MLKSLKTVFTNLLNDETSHLTLALRPKNDFKIRWYQGHTGVELYSNKNITIKSDQHIILMSGNTPVDNAQHPGLKHSIWFNPTRFDEEGNPIPDQEFYNNVKRGRQEISHSFNRLKRRMKHRTSCSCSIKSGITKQKRPKLSKSKGCCS